MRAQPNVSSGAGGKRRPLSFRALRWPIVCWLIILVLIGAIQVVRAQWFDAAIFLCASVIVIVISQVPDRAGPRFSARTLMIGAAVLGAGMSLLPRHVTGMKTLVLATGVAAVLLAWPGASAERRPWSTGLRRMAVAWTVVVIIGCVWELAQFIRGEIDPNQPTFALSDLLDPMMDAAPGRIMFIAVWLAGGIFLLRRRCRR